MFRQDGIPVDASGFFIFDHPDMMEPGPEGEKRRKAAAKKIEKQLKLDAKNPPKPVRVVSEDDDEEAEVEQDDDEEEDLLEPINLEAWLRGEQKVEWQEVTQEIARRYKKRVAKMEDAVAFLVQEGVCHKAALQPKFQKFVD